MQMNLPFFFRAGTELTSPPLVQDASPPLPQADGLKKRKKNPFLDGFIPQEKVETALSAAPPDNPDPFSSSALSSPPPHDTDR